MENRTVMAPIPGEKAMSPVGLLHGRSRGKPLLKSFLHPSSKLTMNLPAWAVNRRGTNTRGRRARTFVTVVGELTQERSSYYCEDCHHGFFPRDEALGLGQELFSPGIRRMVAFTAASLSFQESKTLFL